MSGLGTVRVVCDAPSHYPPRVARITEYTVLQAGADPVRTVSAGPGVWTRLDGDHPVTDDGPGDRSRARLECDLCGLTVEARGDRFNPVLDRLAAGGVSVISLAGLASILT